MSRWPTKNSGDPVGGGERHSFLRGEHSRTVGSVPAPAVCGTRDGPAVAPRDSPTSADAVSGKAASGLGLTCLDPPSVDMQLSSRTWGPWLSLAQLQGPGTWHERSPSGFG